VALYPYIDGQQYSWGEFSTPAHRQGILDLIVELHAVPTTVVRHAMADDFTVPHRDELELSYHDDVAWESGPYARRASVLLCQNADKIGRLVARYDDLVSQQRRRPTRNVVTHGEPHPGNTMLTSAGWLLIDWDTVLIAPPERDLWSLDPGDGSAVRAYSEAAGAVVQPLMLELYRIRWDLADMAASASQFRGPHSDSPDDAMSWEVLSTLIEELPA
jgi:spectinomycin phosphotransferase/16S rRNA (guanine(1405)-N(7))-methyltransferase